MLRRVTRRRFFHFFYSPCPSYLLKITNRLLTFHIHHFPSYRHVPYPTYNIYNTPPPPFTFGRLLNYLSYTSPVLLVSTPRRPLTDLCLASWQKTNTSHKFPAKVGCCNRLQETRPGVWSLPQWTAKEIMIYRGLMYLEYITSEWLYSIRTFCKKEESHKMYLRPKREALLLKYIFRVESVFLLAPPNKQKKTRNSTIGLVSQWISCWVYNHLQPTLVLLRSEIIYIINVCN